MCAFGRGRRRSSQSAALPRVPGEREAAEAKRAQAPLPARAAASGRLGVAPWPVRGNPVGDAELPRTVPGRDDVPSVVLVLPLDVDPAARGVPDDETGDDTAATTGTTVGGGGDPAFTMTSPLVAVSLTVFPSRSSISATGVIAADLHYAVCVGIEDVVERDLRRAFLRCRLHLHDEEGVRSRIDVPAAPSWQVVRAHFLEPAGLIRFRDRLSQGLLRPAVGNDTSNERRACARERLRSVNAGDLKETRIELDVRQRAGRREVRVLVDVDGEIGVGATGTDAGTTTIDPLGGIGVGESVGIGVEVAAAVFVAATVFVGVGVDVNVGVLVAGVSVPVGVFVGGTAVLVAVFVGGIAVFVGVSVGVNVGPPGVMVALGVGVSVGVGVGVFVGPWTLALFTTTVPLRGHASAS